MSIACLVANVAVYAFYKDRQHLREGRQLLHLSFLNSSHHGDFSAIVELPKGTHEYKFYVDGKWIHDPCAVSGFMTRVFTMCCVDVCPLCAHGRRRQTTTWAASTMLSM